jgi:hypothetical protein
LLFSILITIALRAHIRDEPQVETTSFSEAIGLLPTLKKFMNTNDYQVCEKKIIEKLYKHSGTTQVLDPADLENLKKKHSQLENSIQSFHELRDEAFSFLYSSVDQSGSHHLFLSPEMWYNQRQQRIGNSFTKHEFVQAVIEIRMQKPLFNLAKPDQGLITRIKQAREAGNIKLHTILKNMKTEQKGVVHYGDLLQGGEVCKLPKPEFPERKIAENDRTDLRKFYEETFREDVNNWNDASLEEDKKHQDHLDEESKKQIRESLWKEHDIRKKMYENTKRIFQ